MFARFLALFCALSSSVLFAAEPVNPFFGSFGTTIPIALPKFHGIAPSLSLVYNSSGSNGAIGVGWALSGASRIERKQPRGGVPQHDATDVFMLDGVELSPCTEFGGTHCSRIRDYKRVEYRPGEDTWFVTGTNGIVARYEPRLQIDGSALKYLATSLRDLNGNEVRFSYWCPEGADGATAWCYLDEINYSIYRVVLSYEERPDYITRAAGGAMTVMASRLKGVSVYADDVSARAYRLSYRTSRATGRSLLTSVRQLPGEIRPGVVESAGAPLEPLEFAWGDDDALSFAPHWQTSICDRNDGACNDDDNHRTIQLADFDGDGVQDLAYRSDRGIVVHLSQSSGFGPAISTGLCGNSGWPNYCNDWDNHPSIAYRDVDRDGRADIIFRSDRYGVRSFVSRGNLRFDAYQTGGFCHNGSFGQSTCNDRDNHLTVRFPDLNGDGKADVVARSDSGMQTWYSGFGGWLDGSTTGIFSNQAGWADAQFYEHLYYPDLNGDGRADAVGRGREGIYRWLNTGDGFEFNGGPQYCGNDSTYCPRKNRWTTIQYPDLNGDGVADLAYRADDGVVTRYFDGESYHEGALNTGLCVDMRRSHCGTRWERMFSPHVDDRCDLPEMGEAVQYADLNGDSIAELVVRSRDGADIWSTNYRGPGAHPRRARGARFSGQQWQPAGFSQPPNLPLEYALTADFCPGANDSDPDRCRNHNLKYMRIGDVTGDGLPDIVFRTDAGIGVYKNTTGRDVIRRLDNGLGGSTTVEYAPSSRWENQYLPTGAVFPTVSRLTTSDRFGQESTVSYEYAGGLWSMEERKFLGFRRVTSTIHDTGAYTQTYYRQRLASTAKPDKTYFFDASGKILKYTAYTYSENSTAPYYSRMTDKWVYECEGSVSMHEAEHDPDAARRRCRVSRLSLSHDRFGNVLRTTNYGDLDVVGDERYTVYGYHRNDALHLVSLPGYVKKYGGLPSETEGPSKSTYLTEEVYLYDGATSWGTSRRTPPTKGNMTILRLYDTQLSGHRHEKFEHDADGNVIVSKDRRGYAARTTYDANGLFPIEIRNPMGHVTTMSWDDATGQKLSSTDANGAETRTTYDTYGRPVALIDALGGRTEIDYSSANVTVRASPSGARHWTVLDGIGRVVEEAVAGVKRRKVRYRGSSSLITCDSGWLDIEVEDSNPCAIGRAEDPWSPRYRPDGSGGATHTLYDALGRAKKIRNPEGQVTRIDYRYDTLRNKLVETRRAEGARNWTHYERNAHGQLVLARDIPELDAVRLPTAPRTPESAGGTIDLARTPGTPAPARLGAIDAAVRSGTNGPREIRHRYDGLGRKIETIGPNGATATYHYDNFGKPLRICTTDAGCATYAYDGQGNMTRNTDARGQSISYSYDSLGRRTRQENLGRYVTRLFYDEPGHGASKGRLTRVLYPVPGGSGAGALARGGVSYSYDLAGNRRGERRCIWGPDLTAAELPVAERTIEAPATDQGDISAGGTCVNVARTFDHAGRLDEIIYPDDERVQYRYDPYGQLNSIDGIVDNIQRVAGRMTGLDHTNGLKTRYRYQQMWKGEKVVGATQTGVRKTHIAISRDGRGAPGGEVWQWYGFDTRGNLTETAMNGSAVRSDHRSYQYDALDQLTEVRDREGNTQSWSYDRGGNILSNSDVGDYLYDTERPNRLLQAGDSVLRYDAAGRPTAVGAKRVYWNVEGRLERIDHGTSQLRNRFDTDGTLVWQGSYENGVQVDQRFYFGPLVSKRGGNWAKHYFLEGARVARRAGGALESLHSDRLGNVRWVSNDEGSMIDDRTYEPFGKIRYQRDNRTAAHGFTGHRHDDLSGLVYMGARFYDPLLGRFWAPDAVIPNPADPASANAYAYAYNNPLAFTDPTGRAPVAIAVISAAVTSAGATGLVATLAWVGAGLTVAGYLTKNETLMTAGGIISGFSGGALSGAIAVASSPLSPLDSGVKEAIGWSYTAYGIAQSMRGSAGQEADQLTDWEDTEAQWQGFINGETDESPMLAIRRLTEPVHLHGGGGPAGGRAPRGHPSIGGGGGRAVRGGGNGVVGSVSTKGRLKSAGLPTRGRYRYMPPKGYDPRNPLPRTANGRGYVDRMGKSWFKGPVRDHLQRQSFEWDVTRPHASGHINVSSGGIITH